MGEINDHNNSDSFDNQQVTIKGHDNQFGAKVDNENRLWVYPPPNLVPSGLTALNKKLRYLDCNALNGGVARGTVITSTWTDVFSKTGNGYVLFAILNFETSSDWEIRILVDGEELFHPSGILGNDIQDDTVYNQDTSGKATGDVDGNLGIFWGTHDVVTWHGPMQLPVYFATSFVIKVRRTPTKATKKFRAGLVSLTDGF